MSLHPYNMIRNCWLKIDLNHMIPYNTDKMHLFYSYIVLLLLS